MTCPRCGNEWDVSKSPCSRCGLQVRLPGASGAARSHTQSGQQAGGRFPERRLAGDPASVPPSNTMPPAQSSPPSQASRDIFSMPNPSRPQNSQQAQPGGPLRGAPTVSGSLVNNPRSSMPPPQAPAGGRDTSGLGHTPQRTSDPFSPGNSFAGSNLSQPGFSQPDIQSGERTSSRSISSQPLAPSAHSSLGARPTNQLAPDIQRQPLRPSRLVTDARGRELKNTPEPTFTSTIPSGTLSPGGTQAGAMQVRENFAVRDTSSLTPGMLLRSGRYRLRERVGRHEWQPGVYEVIWTAQDAQRGGMQVMVCEVVTPESNAAMVQSVLRTATMSLTSIGRHPHIPAIWDAFSDQGHNFFVFEHVEGESLLAYLRRTGRPLSEQEVIECCLQMTEVLDLFSQQTPGLVHGLIRPENIMVAPGPHFRLTNFSVLLAGGGMQVVAGSERLRLTPYMAPEVARGVIDGRADLYSLMATAYHALTGNAPAPMGTNGGVIAPAQQMNPHISPQLNAILSKGLRPVANQRYQRASELRQELLAMYGMGQSKGQPSASMFGNEGMLGSEGMFGNNTVLPEIPYPDLSMPGLAGGQVARGPMPVQDTIAQMLPNMMATSEGDDQERRLLLPRPEELPPMVLRNDMLNAAFWLGGILVCLLIVIMMSRGFA